MQEKLVRFIAGMLPICTSAVRVRREANANR